jgi:transposase
VHKTGIPWAALPGELGVSGVTCWRWLRDWQAAGVWDRLFESLLAELNPRGELDLSLAVVDSASLRALKGGATPARTRRLAGVRARSTTRFPTVLACRG